MKRWTALALFALVGCGPELRTYTVDVKNNSTEPMTVVLTKDGPPMEMNWLPPEDYGAMRNAPPEAKVNGVVVPPGKSVDQTRQGKFYDDSHGMLRVYRGDLTLERMLGVGPSSPNRKDLPLQPGQNFIVIDANGDAVRR